MLLAVTKTFANRRGYRSKAGPKAQFSTKHSRRSRGSGSQDFPNPVPAISFLTSRVILSSEKEGWSFCSDTSSMAMTTYLDTSVTGHPRDTKKGSRSSASSTSSQSDAKSFPTFISITSLLMSRPR